MPEWSPRGGAPNIISFRLRGKSGEVTVYYGVNEDPAKVGYDSIWKEIPEGSLELARGFPVLKARVSYDATGYSTMFGWVQIVTTELFGPGGEKKAAHDSYPSTSDSDLPFTPFGFLPEMFDAPVTLEHRSEYRWTADTFLTQFPIMRPEPISWILGFRWGYQFLKDPKRPRLLPFEVTGEDAWRTHLPLLQGKFQKWNFR